MLIRYSILRYIFKLFSLKIQGLFAIIQGCEICDINEYVQLAGRALPPELIAEPG